MEHTVIQPDESQTFLFKYGPYGEEHQFNAKEILQKMRAYYQQDFDSIVLLPYAYDAFGYFIAGCQIWDGSTNEIYLQNEEIMSIGYDYVIAVRPLYSDIMPMCAFGTDGQTSYSFGTTSMGTYYDGPPDYYIWNCFRGDYPVPFVFYTECDCPHIFINGTEYHSGDATVRVNYYLPDSDYEYARITYKKNDKPESVNDGTIVPISPSNSYIDIENLVEGKSYYFKIFTNKSESEAFPYTVGPIPSRFTIVKQFKSDNGTFNYNIPSWIEENIISTLENDPLIVSMYFYVGDYPEVANLYNHQFVEYPLQFRTYYGTYPDTGSRPTTSYYVVKDYKLEWLWSSGSTSRDETDYYKNNGEWINSYTTSSSYSRADSNYESFVTIIFILDHKEKKGYPTYVWWGHSERWSMNKYRLQVNKLSTNSQYDQLTSAIYDALK